jgi:hypothetical protein
MSFMFLEDFHHAFRCPDPQSRKWRNDHRREVLQRLIYLNADPVLAVLQIDGLYHWLLDTPTQLPLESHDTAPSLKTNNVSEHRFNLH